MKMLLATSWLFTYFLSYPQNKDFSQINQRISTTADKMPSFPGGEEKFKDYITLYLHNTEMAIGRIVVQFVVEVDGSLSDIQVVKGLCSKCDEEAIRVIKNSPRWTPGEKDGIKVRVKYSATIIY